MEEKIYISKKSRNSYALAAAGQGAIYAMVSSWVLRYYTDALGLELAFVMGLMWFARILNAFADPVVGIFVDKTQTRFGKMRPYLMFTPFIISILTILVFLPINVSQAGKCIYAGFIYVAWGLAYSAADVPFWALPCAMTDNGQERNKLFSFAKFLNSLGGALPTVVVSLLMSDSILGLNKGIFYSAIGFAVIGLIPFAMSFYTSKEIYHEHDEHIKVGSQFKYLFKNKILMLVVLSGIIGFGRYMIQAAYTYVAEYVLISDSSFISNYKQVLGFALIGVGMLPTMLLTPYLLKKFSYKKIMIWSGLFSAAVMGLFFVVGKLTNYNFYWAMFFLLLTGIPLGVYNIVVTAVVGECVDYLEWKEGIRQEGMISSMSTFLAKIGAALATGVIPFVLLLIGYKENQIQTESVKTGIFALITLIPAASLLLSIIPIFYYDFVGEKRDKALAEIEERREKQRAAAEAQAAIESQVNLEVPNIPEDTII